MPGTENEAVVSPRLFIVIPTYNRWQEARVSLTCLRNSTFKDFKILLVEDKCTDGTVEQCRVEFPEIELVHGDGDLWWGGAINLGTKHALELGAEVVIWINDDIRVEPETVGHLMETFRRTGRQSVVCARIRLPSGEGREWRSGSPRLHPVPNTSEEVARSGVGALLIDYPFGGLGVMISAND